MHLNKSVSCWNSTKREIQAFHHWYWSPEYFLRWLCLFLFNCLECICINLMWTTKMLSVHPSLFSTHHVFLSGICSATWKLFLSLCTSGMKCTPCYAQCSITLHSDNISSLFWIAIYIYCIRVKAVKCRKAWL